jgi:hypothetical protein
VRRADAGCRSGQAACASPASARPRQPPAASEGIREGVAGFADRLEDGNHRAQGLSDDRRDLELTGEPGRTLCPPWRAHDPSSVGGEQFVLPAGPEPSYLLAGQIRELHGNQARHDVLVQMLIR